MAYEKQFWEEAYNNSGEEERLEREIKHLKAQVQFWKDQDRAKQIKISELLKKLRDNGFLNESE